jgi:CubicO group peptidase (beta-lactamase class C family)
MRKIFIAILILAIHFPAKTQNTYYPPISQTAFWDTLSPSTQGWCSDSINSLYQYLAKENSKAFILLMDGKIVLEKYFGTFTKDSVWYWASAGKTLTSFLIGKAREEGKLALTDKTSDYLGSGWSSLTQAQEDAITIRNQITMTSGLDDGVPDNHCTLKSCLLYKAAPDTRWAYHNAPYTLLDKVIETATGSTMNLYTQQKISAKTGINGLWFTSGYDNVFASRARNFARWGLLAQNGFNWNGVQLLDTAYARQSVNTSQNMNLSYGYLWWLNGKASYMVPTSQFVFPGYFIPNAPKDMFAAIGKNGQIASVSPSRKLVWIRMGDVPSGQLGEVPFLLADKVWSRINTLTCNSNANHAVQPKQTGVYPNPATNYLYVLTAGQYIVTEITGKTVQTVRADINKGIDVSNLKPGVYLLNGPNGNFRFVKQP